MCLFGFRQQTPGVNKCLHSSGSNRHNRQQSLIWIGVHVMYEGLPLEVDHSLNASSGTGFFVEIKAFGSHYGKEVCSNAFHTVPKF